MEREIVLDTETTGLKPEEGHKIVEIGCVELVNRIPTGKFFHTYINPERIIDAGAMRIHGITNEFVADKPKFSEIVDKFSEFISGAKLVIHNADFDMGFLNWEMRSVGQILINPANVFCTLKHARKLFPGAQNNLDALCKRFKIDNTHRIKHGALLDAEILAEVYLEMMGGRQSSIELKPEKNSANNTTKTSSSSKNSGKKINVHNFPYRKFTPSEEELNSHNSMVEKMKESLWRRV